MDDGASLQLLSEIRDSLRLLPNELVLRLERSRGTELLPERGKPTTAAQGPSVPTKPGVEGKEPWYSSKSETGGKLAALESFGFAVGRLIPEFGQLASEMQALRNIFDAADRLGQAFTRSGKAKEDEEALSGGLGKLSPTQGQLEDRQRYGGGLEKALASATAPPSWAQKFGGDAERMGAAGLPGVAQQMGEPKTAEPEKDQTSALEKLISILENVRRPELPEDVEALSQPGLPATTALQGGKTHEEIARIIEEEVGQQAAGLLKVPVELPASMQQGWPWLSKGGQAPGAVEKVGGIPRAAAQERGPELPGVPIESLYPPATEALSGEHGAGVGELAGLLKNLEGKEDAVLELLRQMLQTLQAENEGVTTENVEELPPEKRTGPTQYEFGREESGTKLHPLFKQLKAMAGGGGEGGKGGLDMKDMVEIMKTVSMFL